MTPEDSQVLFHFQESCADMAFAASTLQHVGTCTEELRITTLQALSNIEVSIPIVRDLVTRMELAD